MLATLAEVFNSVGAPGPGPLDWGSQPGKVGYHQEEHQDNGKLFEKGAAIESTHAATRRESAHSSIQVVRFHVWQDLTAQVDDGLAPLHATVTVEMANELYASLSKPGGSIKIETLRTREVLEARLLVYQAHYGLGLGKPGSKQLQFMMSPTPLYARLSAGESVRGTAKMKFGDRYASIVLPETKVIFTR